jgi:hypothetical protein
MNQEDQRGRQRDKMEGKGNITIKGNLPYWACMTTDRVVTVTQMMTYMSEFNK